MKKTELTFEWDEKKRALTIEKHGIDFLDATQVFEAPHLNAVSKFDAEERWIAIGPLNGVFVAVIYTFRGELLRIITARRARDGEIRKYHESYPGGGESTAKPH